MTELTAFLRATKPKATLSTELGFFDPGSMAITLTDDPERLASADVFPYLAAILHERTHWLHFVGSSSGLFGAYLGAMQAGILVDFTQLPSEAPLDARDLPLLDSPRTAPDRRAAWLGCERLLYNVVGAPRPYFETIESQGGFLRPGTFESISRVLREAAQRVAGTANFGELQTAIWDSAEFPPNQTIPLVESDGVALGATHLMEAVARVNEVFTLLWKRQRMDEPLDPADFFFPPYSTARKVFHEGVGSAPTSGLEACMCILADWALNCPLPPLYPLAGSLEAWTAMPGVLFFSLVAAFDPAIAPDIIYADPEAINELALTLYSQLDSVTPWTPLRIAELISVSFGSLRDVDLPRGLYDGDPPYYLPPADQHEPPRLRYVSTLAYRAAEIRLANPGFCALPSTYYCNDRSQFHDLFDQIQPPFRSVGAHRLVPVVTDRDWFLYFYIAAVQHQSGLAAAYCDANELGAELRSFRGTPLTADEEVDILAGCVRAVLGDGTAAASVIARLM